MARDTTAQHALACLAHPVSLAAALALLANAVVFQRWSPGWWTGKLGDAAWMVFAPFLAALALAHVLPQRAASRRGAVGTLAIAGVGSGLAVVKALPAANAWALRLGAALGVPLKLRLDPTDLLVLPALAVAWAIWRGPNPAGRRLGRRWAALALAGLALAADMPAELPVGITCLGQNGRLYYVLESSAPKKDGAAFGTMMVSEDGLLWDYAGNAREVVEGASSQRRWRTTSEDSPEIEISCGPAAWPVADPADAGAQLYFAAGAGIYRSTDGGATLTLSQPAEAEFTGMVLHSESGNLVLTTLNSVLVRTPAGAWVYGACATEYGCQSLITPTPAETAITPSSAQVTGSVVLQDGACCVGGVAGGEVTIQAAFEAVSPAAPVTEMRTAGVGAGGCRTEEQMAQTAWEPFAPQKTFTFSGIPINWVGYYVSAQFRDAQGNLSEVYCDDISVEGMPPPPTP